MAAKVSSRQVVKTIEKLETTCDRCGEYIGSIEYDEDEQPCLVPGQETFTVEIRFLSDFRRLNKEGHYCQKCKQAELEEIRNFLISKGYEEE